MFVISIYLNNRICQLAGGSDCDRSLTTGLYGGDIYWLDCDVSIFSQPNTLTPHTPTNHPRYHNSEAVGILRYDTHVGRFNRLYLINNSCGVFGSVGSVTNEIIYKIYIGSFTYHKLQHLTTKHFGHEVCFGLQSTFGIFHTINNSDITLVNDQLDAQFFYFIICLLQSSTCFEQRRAHHQEVKLY